jgi:effector-binding domain-containing protein
MRWVILAAVVAVLIVAGTYVMHISNADEPHFTLIKKDGDIEIRQYPALTIAEVKVTGMRINAIRDGFKQLANYIFGGNQNNTQIEMTAPVIQSGHDQEWIVRFVMPMTETIKTLPTPNNSDITILTLPKQKYIVIRFSGSNTEENINKHYDILKKYIKNHHVMIAGDALFAFYNPPWIPPFMRRNEVLVAISSK